MSQKYDDLLDYAIEKIHLGEWDAAIRGLDTWIKQGDIEALAVLGGFYIYGIGVDKDVQHGISMLEKAAQKGSGDACYELWIIFKGDHNCVQINTETALYYLGKGVELGNSKCYGDIGFCFLNGEYMNENPILGYKYSRLAAEAGVPCGILNCAICNDDGIGTVQNAYEARKWYRKYMEIEPDNDFVMVRLAICLADPYGVFGIYASEDMLKESLYYCEQAMSKNNSEAFLICGWFYEMGRIVQQDYDEAYKYMKKSAELGNEIAREHLKLYFKDIFGRYYIRT